MVGQSIDGVTEERLAILYGIVKELRRDGVQTSRILESVDDAIRETRREEGFPVKEASG